nr:zinc finger, CCHC-type [Tanacetum cinerariifolium]
MKNPEQAFVDYESSRSNEVGGKQFTTNQRPRNFNETTNAWKDKPDFNWARTQTFTSPKNGLFSTYTSSYQTRLEKFINLIVLLRKKDEPEEEEIMEPNAAKGDDQSITVRMEKEVKEDSEESDKETKEEKEDDLEYFDTFPTIEELSYHEWILKNPRHPWVNAKNYNMHDLVKKVNELHAMLKLYEKTLQKKDVAPAFYAI